MPRRSSHEFLSRRPQHGVKTPFRNSTAARGQLHTRVKHSAPNSACKEARVITSRVQAFLPPFMFDATNEVGEGAQP